MGIRREEGPTNTFFSPPRVVDAVDKVEDAGLVHSGLGHEEMEMRMDNAGFFFRWTFRLCPIITTAHW